MTPHGEAFVFGDRKNALFEQAPPIPAPVKYAVTNRNPFKITLRVSGLQTEPATFLLRGQAEHGSVKLVPQISREWAEVEYTPPQDRSIKVDTFRFVVSNSRGTSSESIAEIQFKDIGPRLEFLPKIDFGNMRIGDAVTMPIQVLNSGDTVASGTITIRGEWTWGEPSIAYRIDAGKTAMYHLVLRPKTTGKLEGELIFGEAQPQASTLLATVSAWIEATPDPLLLSAKAGETRSALLTLSNETSVPEWVFFESFPELEHPYAVLVQPQQSVSVPLGAVNPSPMEQVGKLVLSGSRGRERVLLWRIAPLGAALGGVEHLSSLLVPGTGKTIRLWNEGGQRGSWLLQTQEPFRVSLPSNDSANLSPTSAKLNLGPGEAVEAILTYRAKTPPALPGALHVRTLRHETMIGGTLKSVVLTTRKPLGIVAPTASQSTDFVRISSSSLTAKPAVNPAAPATPVPAKVTFFSKAPARPDDKPDAEAPQSPQTTRTPTSEPKTTGPSAETMRDIEQMFLPGVLLMGLEVSNVTHHSAVIRFPPLRKIQPDEIFVQFRELESTETGALQSRWNKAKWSVGHTRDGRIELTVKGLPSATATAVRLLGPPFDGGRRVVIHQSDISTLPAPHWLSPSQPWVWAIAALLAGYAFLKHRNRD